MCESELLARCNSAHACACLSIVGSVSTAGRSANQRYRFSTRKALARPVADISPGSQLATLPVHVPSLTSARSAFQRAQTSAADLPAELDAPAVPVCGLPPPAA